jgi:uncharacterized protein (UPF0264 family)
MFLEVRFHDNDFSQRFMYILGTLWKAVKEEKPSSDERTISELFFDLHKCGCLQPMLVSMIAADATIHCIKRAAAMSVYKTSLEYPTNEFYTKYFKSIELEFHKTNKFIEEWHNGEYYWIDLYSGAVGQF